MKENMKPTDEGGIFDIEGQDLKVRLNSLPRLVLLW